MGIPNPLAQEVRALLLQLAHPASLDCIRHLYGTSISSFVLATGPDSLHYRQNSAMAKWVKDLMARILDATIAIDPAQNPNPRVTGGYTTWAEDNDPVAGVMLDGLAFTPLQNSAAIYWGDKARGLPVPGQTPDQPLAANLNLNLRGPWGSRGPRPAHSSSTTEPRQPPPSQQPPPSASSAPPAQRRPSPAPRQPRPPPSNRPKTCVSIRNTGLPVIVITRDLDPSEVTRREALRVEQLDKIRTELLPNCNLPRFTPEDARIDIMPNSGDVRIVPLTQTATEALAAYMGGQASRQVVEGSTQEPWCRRVGPHKRLVPVTAHLSRPPAPPSQNASIVRELGTKARGATGSRPVSSPSLLGAGRIPAPTPHTKARRLRPTSRRQVEHLPGPIHRAPRSPRLPPHQPLMVREVLRPPQTPLARRCLLALGLP